jgi:hypothetical protein
MSKMSDIQKALEQTTTARVVPAPLTVVETPISRPSVAPSRQGRVHIGAYLPVDFKRGIRMLQAATGEDLQSILGAQRTIPPAQSTRGWSGLNKVTCAQVHFPHSMALCGMWRAGAARSPTFAKAQLGRVLAVMCKVDCAPGPAAP